jgi:vesicle coat complex subunit
LLPILPLNLSSKPGEVHVSEQLTQIQSNPLPTERKEIFRLKKGEKILGYVSDREDLPNEWFVVSKNFQKESESTDFGYVNKNDVKITQISIDSE